MTTVNWERQSGEVVEDFAAVLLVQDSPSGNQITASRGDHGIDIRIQTEAGCHIYQVKRYSRTLTPKQKQDIEASWTRFTAEVLPTTRVLSWNLVMPWNPTNEQHAWLNELTTGAGVNIHWIGRTQLDFLAASNPRIVDYFFGDGAVRLQDLMAQALAAGKDLPVGQSGQVLFQVVTERQRKLAILADEIDPFYCYAFEVRPGPLPADWLNQLPSVDEGATFVTYEQVGKDAHLVTRLTARNPLAALHRPIVHELQLELRSAENREDYERFRRYGIPFSEMPAVTVSSTGPAGAIIPSDVRATVSMAVRRSDAPDMEIRFVSPSGSEPVRLRLHDVVLTHGDVGRGIRISGWDESRSMSVETLMSEDEVADELKLAISGVGGMPVTRVAELIYFTTCLEVGGQLEIAFRGGLPIGPAWPVEDEGLRVNRVWRDVVEDLLVIQRHTHSVVQMPDRLSQGTVDAIRRTSRLLKGELVTESGTHGSMTAATDDPFGGTEFALAFSQPLTLQLGDELIETDRMELTHAPHVRLEDTTRTPVAGDVVRFRYIEPPTTRAVSQVDAPGRPGDALRSSSSRTSADPER